MNKLKPCQDWAEELSHEDKYKCKRCGYESEQNYQGYCFQCACDLGIESNPLG